MSKPKVEAIYPLTFMQQTLLMHSLQESDDQGFLQVSCNLEGELNIPNFETAWKKCMQRHGALRASVHWEKIKKPVQIIHPNPEMKLELLDWSKSSLKSISKKIQHFKEEDRKEGFDLTKAPLTRVTLIKMGPNVHHMIWSCHHILLDGWSSAIIFKEVFTLYQAQALGKTASLEAIPGYPSYLNWLQKQDLAEAKTFWEQQFEGFDKPSLLGYGKSNKLTSGNAYHTKSFILDEEQTKALQRRARSLQVTLNTLIQASWGLLIGLYNQQNDSTFGTTVSGRNVGLPNMDLLAGMFSNVLPIRVKWESNAPLVDWLKKLHAAQSGIQNFEYITLGQISDWINWPGKLPLLDSLMVFENFPWSSLGSDQLKVNDFSGGVTSTYPVTLMIVPGDAFQFQIKYNKYKIDIEVIDWIKTQLEQLLVAFTDNKHITVQDLVDVIDDIKVKQNLAHINEMIEGKKPEVFLRNNNEHNFITPRNHAELEIAKIWEQLFGRSPISVTENFFEIGGTSILAVKMLALIEEKLKCNLPPATLLKNPTIAALAKVISNEQQASNWSALVPLRTKGNKPPIFCMHAGGGHIYFYYALSKYLSDDQPIYSMQPVGLDGVSAYHQSIKEMAADYIKEIKSVQPEGPYSLLGTCFSNAVCLEIAHQLKEKGETISSFIVVDSGGRELGKRVRIPSPVPPVGWRLKRFINLEFKQAKDAVLKKISKRMEKLEKKWILLTESKQEKRLREMKQHLGKLYEDYYWKPCQQRVTLIRSSEFNDDPNKNFHLERWGALAAEGLDIHVVEGHHETLFLEPEVQNLATKLQQCLDDAYNNSVNESMRSMQA